MIRSRPGLIVAVVMSGVGKMNPAVVSARMDVATGVRTVTVTLRGVAAEGLIKQHAGERAVKAVKYWLQA